MRKAILYCLISALFIFSSYSQLEASNIFRVSPSPILYSSGGSVIVVEKSTHKLFIYDQDSILIDSFKVTTGKRQGDKKKRGDLKTPEGIYFFTGTIDDSLLPGKYGVEAIPLDYPNPVDRLKKKTGSGIWMHGTNDPARLEKPNDSRGCVVLSNQDLLKVASLVDLLNTPVVIVERFAIATVVAADAEYKNISQWYFGSKEGLDRSFRLKILRHESGYGVLSFIEGSERRVLYFTKDERGYKAIASRMGSVVEKDAMENLLQVSLR